MRCIEAHQVAAVVGASLRSPSTNSRSALLATRCKTPRQTWTRELSPACTLLPAGPGGRDVEVTAPTIRDSRSKASSARSTARSSDCRAATNLPALIHLNSKQTSNQDDIFSESVASETASLTHDVEHPVFSAPRHHFADVDVDWRFDGVCVGRLAVVLQRDVTSAHLRAHRHCRCHLLVFDQVEQCCHVCSAKCCSPALHDCVQEAALDGCVAEARRLGSGLEAQLDGRVADVWRARLAFSDVCKNAPKLKLSVKFPTTVKHY